MTATRMLRCGIDNRTPNLSEFRRSGTLTSNTPVVPQTVFWPRKSAYRQLLPPGVLPFISIGGVQELHVPDDDRVPFLHIGPA